MTLFVPLCALAILRAKESKKFSYCVLAGILAGGAAGTKYTGIIFAGVLFVAFLVEIRSAMRTLLFFGSALAAGIWPYARNWIWAGDPVFPFLIRQFAPQHLNESALAVYIQDTRILSTHELWELPRYAFFAAFDSAHPGFWQMMGPLVLCFAPLTLLALRGTQFWRICAISWLGGALLSGYLSSIPRFGLPCLPIALAASFAGVAQLRSMNWRFTRYTAWLATFAYLAAGAAGLVLYERPAWMAAAGVISREKYLEQRAPDHFKTEFVNREVGKLGGGNTMVFFRHVYHLNVPFEYADPPESWPMDPDKLRTGLDLYALLKRENVRWVLKEGEFPLPLRAQFEQLQSAGFLKPCAEEEGRDFQGNRFNAVRAAQQLTLFCVQ